MRRFAVGLWVAVVLGWGGRPALAGGTKTIRSAEYGVQVSYPTGWSVSPMPLDIFQGDHHPKSEANSLMMVAPAPGQCRVMVNVTRSKPISLAAVEKLYGSQQGDGPPAKLVSVHRRSFGGARGHDLVFRTSAGPERVIVVFHGGYRYTLAISLSKGPHAKQDAREVSALVRSMRVFKANPSASHAGFAAPGPTGVLPLGTRVDVIQLASGAPLELKPREQLAFIWLTDVKVLEMELSHPYSLAELVHGVKTRVGVKGLRQSPATDKDYAFKLALTGKRYRMTAVPKRPGLGGWLMVGDGSGAKIYFGPKGVATEKSEEIGSYSTEGGFQR